MPTKSWTRSCSVPALGLLALFASEGLTFIIANSQTSDEAAHLVAGYAYLIHGDVRLNPEYPPLMRALPALPVYLWYQLPLKTYPEGWRNNQLWGIGRDFLYTAPIPPDRILTLARVSNLVLGTALVGLIGFWAYRLWGTQAGLLALTLAALEPNLVAHSSLATTDIGEALFVFLSVYLLWEYTARPSAWFLAALGVATGVTLASKQLTVLLLAVVALLLAGHALFGRTIAWPWRGPWMAPLLLRRRMTAAGLTLAVVLILAAGVVELAYGGQGVESWWEGLQVIRSYNEEGHPAFLMGEYSREGWWYYFLVALAIKTPVGSLALIAASLILAGAGTPLRPRVVAFLLLPVVVWLVAMCWARINVGLRHILPVYPFLFVAAGRLATVYLRHPSVALVLIGVPLLSTAVSALRVAPHQLAYFNELVGGPGEGYRYLSDSNLDWGQELKGLKAFMDREGVPVIYLSYFDTAPPAAYGIRYQYLPTFGRLGPPLPDVLPLDAGRELLAIGAMNLQGVQFPDKDLYRWLYDRTPIAKVGYSVFVYDLTHDADAHLRLTQIYVNEQRRDLAARELRRALAIDPGNTRAVEFLYLLQETE